MSALALFARRRILHCDSVFELVVYLGIPWRRDVGAVISSKPFASKPIVPCLVMPVFIEMSSASEKRFILVCEALGSVRLMW